MFERLEATEARFKICLIQFCFINMSKKQNVRDYSLEHNPTQTGQKMGHNENHKVMIRKKKRLILFLFMFLFSSWLSMGICCLNSNIIVENTERKVKHKNHHIEQTYVRYENHKDENANSKNNNNNKKKEQKIERLFAVSYVIL